MSTRSCIYCGAAPGAGTMMVQHADWCQAPKQVPVVMSGGSMPPHIAGTCKLTRPAMVGNTTFGVGVDERLVIERAQREHEYAPQRVNNDGAIRFAAEILALHREHLGGFDGGDLQELAVKHGLLEPFECPDTGCGENCECSPGDECFRATQAGKRLLTIYALSSEVPA